MGINFKRRISSLVPGDGVRSHLQNALTVEWAGHKTVLVDVPTSGRSNEVELSTRASFSGAGSGYGRLADDDEDAPPVFRNSIVDVRELYDGYGMGFDSERQRHSAYDLAALRDAAGDEGKWSVAAVEKEREIEREGRLRRERSERGKGREGREGGGAGGGNWGGGPGGFVRPRIQRSSTAPNAEGKQFKSNNPFAHPFDHGLDGEALESTRRKVRPPVPTWAWDSDRSPTSPTSEASGQR